MALVSTAAHLLAVIVVIALTTASLQAEEDAPRAPANQHKEECSLYVRNETINKDGCVAVIPLFFCKGTCNSLAIPNIFYSKYVK